MKIIQYMLLANVSLSICYLIYKLIAKNESNFRQLRFFLLGSIIISLLLPLNSFKLNSGLFSTQSNPTYTQQFNVKDNFASNHVKYQPIPIKKETSNFKNIDWPILIKFIYLSISILLIFRVIMQITQLVYRYYKSEKTKYLQFTILSNTYYKSSFSFFNWIFIHKETSLNEDKDKIIAHEIIHASQYHSFDLILIELLSAVMWFNPVIWMMRKSMQLLHEYLADEGALSTGIDKLKYQALLINQLTEERLICVSSSFNHSLIKKRMIMMTKSKFNKKSKLKILALLPVSIILFVFAACINGLFPNDASASPRIMHKTSAIIEFKLHQINKLNTVEDTIKKVKVVGVNKEKPTNEIRFDGFEDLNNQKDNSQLIYMVYGVKADNLKQVMPDSIESNYIQIRKADGTKLLNILYIVDGVETLIDPFSSLNPDDIESITVVKDKSLKALYPTKNYDALLVIKTKLKKE